MKMIFKCQNFLSPQSISVTTVGQFGCDHLATINQLGVH